MATPAGRKAVHGFLLSEGVYTTFDAPGVAITFLSGVNDRGQIVGFTNSDLAGTPVVHGFLLDDGRRGSVHADRLPGRVRRNGGIWHRRPRPDRRRLREPRCRAGWPARSHADADDDVGL